ELRQGDALAGADVAHVVVRRIERRFPPGEKPARRVVEEGNDALVRARLRLPYALAAQRPQVEPVEEGMVALRAGALPLEIDRLAVLQQDLLTARLPAHDGRAGMVVGILGAVAVHEPPRAARIVGPEEERATLARGTLHVAHQRDVRAPVDACIPLLGAAELDRRAREWRGDREQPVPLRYLRPRVAAVERLRPVQGRGRRRPPRDV